ncbi:MAG: 1-(5-phosphoribosyl)-5-[Oscillospiraceae bacterium]|nr:1-(5-phosphoribosyl)-5-[(5-phosphoribosylamino)methylideneamino]imidazole-4-carboxamide isomerase [Oscillospiraceae bacterium]
MKLTILPAIDIKDGNCVRLLKGDFATVEKVAEDPLLTAGGFEENGAEWLHMVDLDGAKDATPRNRDIFVKVANSTGLKVEVGGGIRSMETVDYYLSNGIERVILGSAAVKNPAFVKEAVEKYGERIAVGIDAKNGKVAAEGWLDDSDVDYIALAKEMEKIGVQYIIFTDISKDGTLAGPNLEQLAAINEAVSCNIIASGGICNIGDIAALKELGVYGAICGKSLYKGTLELSEAIKVGEGE